MCASCAVEDGGKQINSTRIEAWNNITRSDKNVFLNKFQLIANNGRNNAWRARKESANNKGYL